MQKASLLALISLLFSLSAFSQKRSTVRRLSTVFQEEQCYERTFRFRAKFKKDTPKSVVLHLPVMINPHRADKKQLEEILESIDRIEDIERAMRQKYSFELGLKFVITTVDQSGKFGLFKVGSRPGSADPEDSSTFFEGLREIVKNFDFNESAARGHASKANVFVHKALEFVVAKSTFSKQVEKTIFLPIVDSQYKKRAYNILSSATRSRIRKSITGLGFVDVLNPSSNFTIDQVEKVIAESKRFESRKFTVFSGRGFKFKDSEQTKALYESNPKIKYPKVEEGKGLPFEITDENKVLTISLDEDTQRRQPVVMQTTSTNRVIATYCLVANARVVAKRKKRKEKFLKKRKGYKAQKDYVGDIRKSSRKRKRKNRRSFKRNQGRRGKGQLGTGS